MVIKPAVCFADHKACEELIQSFIRIMLRQQIFFAILNQKFQLTIFTLANDHLSSELKCDLGLSGGMINQLQSKVSQK